MTTQMRLDWQAVVAEMSQVQKLVHLAMRLDKASQEAIRAELVKARQRAYNDELTIQARRAGCTRLGNLRGGAILTELNQLSQEDATLIVNTYNYDLAMAILAIAKEYSRANRNTYAAQLRTWETNRAAWKAQQIGQYTENTARAKAQADFYKLNTLDGVSILQPRMADCPVCQGWINRGKVSTRVAINNPPPYHVNCPHLWSNRPEKVTDCADLWMG